MTDLLSSDVEQDVSVPALAPKPDVSNAPLSQPGDMYVPLKEAEQELRALENGVDELSVDEKPPPTPTKDHVPDPAVLSSPPPPPPPPKDLPRKDPEKMPNGLGLQINTNADALQTERLHVEPPLTPGPSRPGSRAGSPAADGTGKSAQGRADSSSEDEAAEEARTEIHDLFEKSHRASIADLEQLQKSPQPSSSGVGSPAIGVLPPRSSSLASGSMSPIGSADAEKPEVLRRTPFAPTTTSLQAIESTPSTPITPHRPPPPDDDLPFDFHRFLSQLRHRSADPVAKFLRSFLNEFAKKQWVVNEQQKIVHDFLDFIYAKMEHCEVWRDVGDVEIDNAREGMEKLVMNRLYTQTFSPAIPPPDAGRHDERFPGRRGQHQEDVDRDEILAQKVRIFSWIREEHLDIDDTIRGDGGRRFLDLAVKELLKIGSYRAPRDKVICVLNCCKVIFGLLRHSKSEQSADKFVPLLIYVTLRANPDHLVSNVQYILRFRNPDKLSGEAGYYLSSLMGAIQFIETLGPQSLTITPEDYDRNVESAVAAIAERPPPPPPTSPPPVPPRDPEKSGLPPPPPPPRKSTERDRGHERQRSLDSEGATSDDEPAVAGLLRTIQKPLSTIGRIFSDAPESSNAPPRSPQDDTLLTTIGGRRRKPEEEKDGRKRQQQQAVEAAARQASAEAEEARRIGRIEYENVVEILKGMFPGLDRDVIGDVVRVKEGRVGLAVDACLALSS